MAAGQVIMSIIVVTVLLLMVQLAAGKGHHPPGTGHHPPGKGHHKKSTPKPAAPSAGGSWISATATFYGGNDSPDTLGGACGYGNVYTAGYGADTAALSTALWDHGLACGSCWEVACDSSGTKYCTGGSSITLTATNLCPPAPEKPNDNGGWCNVPRQHFDMAVPAFEKLAAPVAGIVPVKYRRVSCVKSGEVRFKLNGHDYFTLILITNVGGAGAVHSVTITVGGATKSLSQNWGQNWQYNDYITGKAFSITITTDDVKSLTSSIPAGWSYGQTYSGGQF